MSDTLADAALATASAASDIANAYVVGSTANQALIAATQSAVTAFQAARDAADIAMAAVALDTAPDIFAAIATAASLAQDTAALAEVINVLDVLEAE